MDKFVIFDNEEYKVDNLYIIEDNIIHNITTNDQEQFNITEKKYEYILESCWYIIDANNTWFYKLDKGSWDTLPRSDPLYEFIRNFGI